MAPATPRRSLPIPNISQRSAAKVKISVSLPCPEDGASALEKIRPFGLRNRIDIAKRLYQIAAMNREKSEIGVLPLAAFSLSCLGALSFGLLAIPGVICGHLARKKTPAAPGASFSGAALIIGYSVLALFYALPLLILAGFLVLSMVHIGPSVELGALKINGSRSFDLMGSIDSFLTQNFAFVLGAGFALLVLALILWGVPRLARWQSRRQLRKLVAMNRSR